MANTKKPNFIRDGYDSYPLEGSEEVGKITRTTTTQTLDAPEKSSVKRESWDKPAIDLISKK